jgi:hypothetical protein
MALPRLFDAKDKGLRLLSAVAMLTAASPAGAQAWRDCIPRSVGPGGCDSYGPDGGLSVALGGGQSYGPGGGRSFGPGGGQSFGPGGGRSYGPGGGLSPGRNWRRGLDPDTLRPAPRGLGPTPGAANPDQDDPEP